MRTRARIAGWLTLRQPQAQTIQQQVTQLHSCVAGHGWTVRAEHVVRDADSSGAKLTVLAWTRLAARRPG